MNIRDREQGEHGFGQNGFCEEGRFKAGQWPANVSPVGVGDIQADGGWRESRIVED